MKNIFRSFFVIAAAALTLVGCQKKEIEQPQNEGDYVYTFAIDDETKAVIGDSNIEWVEGDQVGIFISPVGDFAGFKGYAKVDVSTSPKKVILYSNSAIPAGAKAYAYAPYDADNKNKEADEAKIVVNSIQIGAQNSAMPLVGLPFEVKEEIDPRATTGNGQIQFMNLGSIINFKIFSTNEEYQSETIQSIQFEATKPIAGVGYIDLTAVNMNDEGTLELAMDTEENTVKVNEEVAVVADKESAQPIKMVILPGTFEGTLTVITDAATYTKAIPEREFGRSHTRTFSLDLDKAERTAGVVETVKTLPYSESFADNQGDFTIENVVMPSGISFVWSHSSHNMDYYMQASAYVGGNRYETESMLVSPWIDLTEVASAEVSFSNAYRYVTTPEDFFTFWVKTDEEGAEWTQEEINNYGAGNFVWGDAVVKLTKYVGNKVKVAFKYVSGGTGSDTGTWEIMNFSAYASKLDTELSYDVDMVTVNVDEIDNFEAPVLVNPNDLSVTYASDNEDVAEVDETGNVTLTGDTGSATITASFAGDDTYKEDSVSYTIIVVGSTVTDVINRAFTGVTGTSYVNWSGKTGISGAVYAGNSAGGNDAVQLRSSNSAGIITTTSGGRATKVTVTWNTNTADGRTLDVYGKNSAYSNASDLYNNNNQGTLLGSIVNGTSTSIEITGNYTFIGLRSKSGAMYLDEIQIEWSSEAAPADPVITLSNIPTSNISADGDVVTINYSIENPVEGVSVQASASDTWVNDFDYSAGAISFAVDPKTTPGTRTATITVSYAGAEDKTFQITQDGYSSGEEKTLEFTYDSHSGWTISEGADDKGTYFLLKNNSYIDSPTFSFTKINSVFVTLRSFGGTQFGPIDIMYGDTVIGSQNEATKNLTEYTINVESPSAGSGSLRFIGQNTSEANGPGISKIVIVYE